MKISPFKGLNPLYPYKDHGIQQIWASENFRISKISKVFKKFALKNIFVKKIYHMTCENAISAIKTLLGSLSRLSFSKKQFLKSTVENRYFPRSILSFSLVLRLDYGHNERSVYRVSPQLRALHGETSHGSASKEEEENRQRDYGVESFRICQKSKQLPSGRQTY